MPSPLGHALGGIAAGFLVARVPVRAGAVHRTAALRQAALYATLGAAADLDLLVGAHSGPTHGLGAALLIGGLIALLTQKQKRWLALFRKSASHLFPEGGVTGTWAAAGAAAYASHTLLDWLGHDTSAPIGIMALWPFTREYYESSLHVFMAVSRRYWLPGFWHHNFRAVLRELAILVPVVAVVVAARRRAVE